jgi:GNAT superfamily N-acetyltransferase
MNATSPSQQELPESVASSGEGRTRERPHRWQTVSTLRWRSGIGQQIIFLTNWFAPADQREGQAGPEAAANNEQPAAAELPSPFLPPLEMLRTVAERWAKVVERDDEARPALIAFRSAGALAPAEIERWCPGATVRLYTLGGRVPPLPDTALAEPPLERYSVVRAPNMSFWPQLRALIEEQERETPGLELWEDLGRDLDLLEQELAWWIARPQGLILNLYDGADLVGHLALARQRDEAEGCDGWGILSLHIARRARGQGLGALLQRVAATLIYTRRLMRRAHLGETRVIPAITQSPAAQDAPPRDDTASSDGEQPVSTGQPDAGQGAQTQPDADQPPGTQPEWVPAPAVPDWPYLFGFVSAQNFPALRGAYRAGRRIIGTYVDVPIEALKQQG